MTIITITVENKGQKDDIMKVLENAEVNGELNFAFGVHTKLGNGKREFEWIDQEGRRRSKND